LALISVTEGDSLCKVVSPVYGESTPIYLRNVEHYVKHKGIEFLIDRQKSIFQATLQLLAGHTDMASQILSESRIRERKDKPGVPSGVEGIGVLYVLQSRKPQILRKGIASLRGYTALRLSKPSRKQLSKASEAITKPPSTEVSYQTLRQLSPKGRMVEDITYESWDYLKENPKPCRVWKPFDRYPKMETEDHLDASKLSGLSAFYSGRYRLGSDLRKIPFSSASLSSMVCGDIPNSVISLFGDLNLRKEAADFQKADNLPGYGKITFLQEGGGKARVVCTPSFWMQTYFRPLHSDLYKYLAWIEGSGKTNMNGVSCVLDQNKGAYLLSSWLQEDRKIFSVDLQSATDRFPRSVQLNWLKEVGLDKWIQPIEEASSGQYFVPHLTRKDQSPVFWTYGCGQPMGLYGSFFLFHLTHRGLLEDLCERYHIPRPAYAVLGDDVLIGDPKLYRAYKDLLGTMDVPLSSSKSLEADSVGAFAGFIGVSRYSADREVCTIFRPFKFGQDYSLQGRSVSLLHTLGKDMRRWGTWWSKALDVYNATRHWRNPDLSPLLPSDREQVRGDTAVGSKFFGSVSQRVMYMFDSNFPELQLPDRVMGSWNTERAILFAEQQPFVNRNFDPDMYFRAEMLRKKGFHPSLRQLGIDLPSISKLLERGHSEESYPKGFSR